MKANRYFTLECRRVEFMFGYDLCTWGIYISRDWEGWIIHLLCLELVINLGKTESA